MKRHEYVQKILDTFGKIDGGVMPVFKDKEDKLAWRGRVGDAIQKIEEFESFVIQRARKEFAEDLIHDIDSELKDIHDKKESKDEDKSK